MEKAFNYKVEFRDGSCTSVSAYSMTEAIQKASTGGREVSCVTKSSELRISDEGSGDEFVK